MSRAPIVLACLIAATPSPFMAPQLSSPMERAALASIRTSPLDSLVSPYCTRIRLDPNVRRLRQPTVFGPTTDTLFTIGPIADSIRSLLPVSVGAYDQPDTDSTASVLIGIVRPDTTKSEATFILEVAGCRMSGFIIRVDARWAGPDVQVELRGIQEG